MSTLAADSVVTAFDRQTMRRFDVDGRMHVESCNISKANVCGYYGREIPNHEGLRLEPNKIYQLYRHPDELARGADTFKNLQLLMLHTAVNANDPKTHVTVGTIGSDVRFEAPYLKASIAVWTQEAIRLIEAKQQAELSSSYRYRADMTPGVTPEGVAYDGVMRDIMANHVALVEKGRAGPDVYVTDSLPTGMQPMKRRKLVESIVKQLNVEATDALLLAVDKAIDKEIDAEDKADDEREDKADDAEKDAEDEAAEDGKDEESQSGKPVAARSKDKAKDKARDKARDASPESPGPKAGERGKSITADNKHGMDSALSFDAAVDLAVARINARDKARRDVEPLVGVVAMDSAEEIYRFALRKCDVATDGIHVSALPALVESEKRARKAVPGSTIKAAPKLAMDATANIASAIPGLGRIHLA